MTNGDEEYFMALRVRFEREVELLFREVEVGSWEPDRPSVTRTQRTTPRTIRGTARLEDGSS